jgi:hypothetical protein
MPPLLDSLPAYADDDQLSLAIVGKRSAAWRQFVLLHEGKGLPKIHPILGGRYVPAIKRFLDLHEGLDQVKARPAELAPTTEEIAAAWNARKPRRRV